MKEKDVFFNPFRLISPKLNAEASRLTELYETPPPEMTCLEEGLLVMVTKLMEMTQLVSKNLILCDPEKISRCKTLGEEVHQEEKELTNAIVCNPDKTEKVLKTVILFPGKLERSGDHLESILNCAYIKDRDGIAFSERATSELTLLFDTLADNLKGFRDLLSTLNPSLLDILINQQKKIIQMTIDYADAHEDRLLKGDCVPRASSIFLDILESVRDIAQNVNEMTESLKKISDTYKTA
jgi:Na+/phosphate symporter